MSMLPRSRVCLMFWIAVDPDPEQLRVWIATGHTDMRRGFNGLALQVQEALKRDPHDGQIFVFRGRRGGLVKVLWHDGQGEVTPAKWSVL